MVEWSATWTWLDGQWIEGNPPIMGPRTHAAWLGSVVFDGARSFEGIAPDLDLHCARVNQSARELGLAPTMSDHEIERIAREGIAKFPKETALYIRPMYWAEDGGFMSVPPDPATTRFCLTLYDTPMPPVSGFSVMLGTIRRPAGDQAPIRAKAACLYPNSGRALLAARAAGFDNALVRDALGNIAELATANVFMAKDGIVKTPFPNGAFLNGITRQRVIGLLRADGITVEETTLTYEDFAEADEIFSTGNYSKVVPVNRLDARKLAPGPMFQHARERYWDWAHS